MDQDEVVLEYANFHVEEGLFYEIDGEIEYEKAVSSGLVSDFGIEEETKTGLPSLVGFAGTGKTPLRADSANVSALYCGIALFIPCVALVYTLYRLLHRSWRQEARGNGYNTNRDNKPHGFNPRYRNSCEGVQEALDELDVFATCYNIGKQENDATDATVQEWKFACNELALASQQLLRACADSDGDEKLSAIRALYRRLLEHSRSFTIAANADIRRGKDGYGSGSEMHVQRAKMLLPVLETLARSKEALLTVRKDLEAQEYVASERRNEKEALADLRRAVRSKDMDAVLLNRALCQHLHPSSRQQAGVDPGQAGIFMGGDGSAAGMSMADADLFVDGVYQAEDRALDGREHDELVAERKRGARLNKEIAEISGVMEILASKGRNQGVDGDNVDRKRIQEQESPTLSLTLIKAQSDAKQQAEDIGIDVSHGAAGETLVKNTTGDHITGDHTAGDKAGAGGNGDFRISQERIGAVSAHVQVSVSDMLQAASIRSTLTIAQQSSERAEQEIRSRYADQRAETHRLRAERETRCRSLADQRLLSQRESSAKASLMLLGIDEQRNESTMNESHRTEVFREDILRHHGECLRLRRRGDWYVWLVTSLLCAAGYGLCRHSLYGPQVHARSLGVRQLPSLAHLQQLTPADALEWVGTQARALCGAVRNKGSAQGMSDEPYAHTRSLRPSHPGAVGAVADYIGSDEFRYFEDDLFAMDCDADCHEQSSKANAGSVSRRGLTGSVGDDDSKDYDIMDNRESWRREGKGETTKVCMDKEVGVEADEGSKSERVDTPSSLPSSLSLSFSSAARKVDSVLSERSPATYAVILLRYLYVAVEPSLYEYGLQNVVAASELTWCLLTLLSRLILPMLLSRLFEYCCLRALSNWVLVLASLWEFGFLIVRQVVSSASYGMIWLASAHAALYVVANILDDCISWPVRLVVDARPAAATVPYASWFMRAKRDQRHRRPAKSNTLRVWVDGRVWALRILYPLSLCLLVAWVAYRDALLAAHQKQASRGLPLGRG
jgi:hypothetical protein